MQEKLILDRPSPWVERFARLVRPGAHVLDLACGGGRHARLLAAQGATVTAIDRDATAIGALDGWPGVFALRADIENEPWPLGGQLYDAIVVTNYLFRPRFPELRGCMATAGMLIYETFMVGNERFGKPSNPDFLLRPGELLELCAGMWIAAFEQGEISDGKPAMVQRICAIRSSELGLRIP